MPTRKRAPATDRGISTTTELIQLCTYSSRIRYGECLCCFKKNAQEQKKKFYCNQHSDVLWQFLLKSTETPTQEQISTINKLLSVFQIPLTTKVRLVTGESSRRAYTLRNPRDADFLDGALHSQNIMTPYLEWLFWTAKVWCRGGHTPERLISQLASLCRHSAVAHQLVCCCMAKLLGEPNLLDKALSTSTNTTLTFDVAEVPQVSGETMYLPLGESRWLIPHVNLSTGDVADKVPHPEAVLSHELDHWSSLLGEFLSSEFSGYKDLTLTHIFPHLQTITASQEAFKKKMAEDPLFFDAVALFFDCTQRLDESSKSFQKRVLRTALEHFEDLESRARASWADAEEIRDIAGFTLVQTPQKDLVLFINMLSNACQAIDTGNDFAWLHNPYNEDSLKGFTDVSVNEDVIWLLAELMGVSPGEYFTRKAQLDRDMYTPSLQFVLQSGPLNAMWRTAQEDLKEIAQQILQG